MIWSKIKKDEEFHKFSRINHVSKVDNKKKELRSLIDGKQKNIFQETEHYFSIDPKITIKGTIEEDYLVFKSAKSPVKYTSKVNPETQAAPIYLWWIKM